MNRPFRRLSFLITILGIVAVSFSSCISQKKTVYLQSAEGIASEKVTFENDMTKYKIQPGDFLYINVSNLDPKNMTSFDGDTRAEYSVQSEMGVYLKSYQVSDSGMILFPVIGKIEVAGMTVEQARERIQSIMDDFYQLTTITVKLVNFKVSLLGEVNRPGTYSIYQDKLNIFQALSLAGDVSPYGDRKDVSIIRKTKTGGTEIIKVNLLSKSLLELPGFYLQPEDIIYIEPMRSKNFAFTSFPYSIVLSTITTTLLILNFFK
jgi:polysaccharide export outer membrane protein